MSDDYYAKWRIFGNEVKRLRVLAGLTQRQVASRINLSQAMLGGIERAQRAPRKDHADDLDIVLNTDGLLTRLWHDTAGKRDVPEWFKNALMLERNASEIRAYEPLVIPGVLQIAAYARTLLVERRPKIQKDEVEQAVTTRTKRLPELREGRDPLMLFVIREAVFTQNVGDEMIMGVQLRHIVELVKEEAIQVQVLPNSGASTGLCLPFRLIKLGDTRRTVAYGEHIAEGQVFDTPDVVDDLTNLFGQLQAQAWSPAGSLELLHKIIGDRYDNVA